MHEHKNVMKQSYSELVFVFFLILKDFVFNFKRQSHDQKSLMQISSHLIQGDLAGMFSEFQPMSAWIDFSRSGEPSCISG